LLAQITNEQSHWAYIHDSSTHTVHASLRSADEEEDEPMPAGGSPEREAERTDTLTRIGDAVRERRLELEISSQAALAERAGVVTNTVAFLERGQKMPWMANRRKIETALGWPVGTLTAMYQGAATPTLEPAPISPAPPLPPAQSSSELSGRVLSIALRTTEMAATIAEVAARYSDTDPEAAAAVAEIDRQAHALEAVISAGLLDVDLDSEAAFDQMVSVLTQLRRGRQAIRNVGRVTQDGAR